MPYAGDITQTRYQRTTLNPEMALDWYFVSLWRDNSTPFGYLLSLKYFWNNKYNSLQSL